MSDDKSNTALLCLILNLASLPIDGWAVSTLWRWFVTPTLGVSAPNTWACAGFVLMVGLASRQYIHREDNQQLTASFLSVAKGPFAVLLGLILKGFV